jgi:hypothetical protein
LSLSLAKEAKLEYKAKNTEHLDLANAILRNQSILGIDESVINLFCKGWNTLKNVITAPRDVPRAHMIQEWQGIMEQMKWDKRFRLPD